MNNTASAKAKHSMIFDDCWVRILFGRHLLVCPPTRVSLSSWVSSAWLCINVYTPSRQTIIQQIHTSNCAIFGACQWLNYFQLSYFYSWGWLNILGAPFGKLKNQKKKTKQKKKKRCFCCYIRLQEANCFCGSHNRRLRWEKIQNNKQ